MNADRSRQRAAYLVVAAAVCGGLYAFIAQPLRTRMEDARAELGLVFEKNQRSQIMQATFPELLLKHDEAIDRAAEITERSQPGSDEAALFSEIMRLAGDSGVRVQHISPVKQSGRGRSSVAESLALLPTEQSTLCTISAVGSYASAARFLESLRAPWAYCIVRRCHISPDFSKPGESDVGITCTLEVLSFDPSPVAPAETGYATLTGAGR